MEFEKQDKARSELNLSKKNFNKYYNQNNYEFEVMRQNLIEKKSKSCDTLRLTQNLKNEENNKTVCNLINKVLKTKNAM